jgi:hypothetical protein
LHCGPQQKPAQQCLPCRPHASRTRHAARTSKVCYCVVPGRVCCYSVVLGRVCHSFVLGRMCHSVVLGRVCCPYTVLANFTNCSHGQTVHIPAGLVGRARTRCPKARPESAQHPQHWKGRHWSLQPAPARFITGDLECMHVLTQVGWKKHARLRHKHTGGLEHTGGFEHTGGLEYMRG